MNKTLRILAETNFWLGMCIIPFWYVLTFFVYIFLKSEIVWTIGFVLCMINSICHLLGIALSKRMKFEVVEISKEELEKFIKEKGEKE